jgi:hypothetical protein
MGKKFSRCIRRDTFGTADESYVGCDALQGISVQRAAAMVLVNSRTPSESIVSWGAWEIRMSCCQPDSASGLPACLNMHFRKAGSLSAKSAKLADIRFRPFQFSERQ